MGQNRLSDIVKQMTPPTEQLKLFYWGSFITFIGIILYQYTEFIFFLWTPSLLIATIRELKSKKPSFFNWLYFSVTSIMVLILALTIL